MTDEPKPPRNVSDEGTASFLHSLPREDCPYPPTLRTAKNGYSVGTKPLPGRRSWQPHHVNLATAPSSAMKGLARQPTSASDSRAARTTASVVMSNFLYTSPILPDSPKPCMPTKRPWKPR
jgi:hypothetical protein